MDGTAPISEQVRQYYGSILQTNRDLETAACRSTEALPGLQQESLSLIHPEILEKTYGCGSPSRGARSSTSVAARVVTPTSHPGSSVQPAPSSVST